MAERAAAARALGAALGLAAAAWAFRPLWGIDVFWHVVVGRLIQAGGIPERDVLSAAHPEAAWTTFQWGYEVLVARIDAAGGLAGLRGLHAAVIGAAAGLWAGAQSRRAGAAAGLAAGLTWLLLFEDRVRARPHVFEALFVLALFVLLRRGEKAHRLAVWGALVLAPIWANLHAVSALWWVAIFGTWVLGHAPGRGMIRPLGMWALGVATLLAAPGAIDGISGAFFSHREWPAAFVPELQRTTAYLDQGLWGVIQLVGVGAGTVAALAHLRSEATRTEKLALLGFAAASWLIVRWSWLGAIPLAVALERRPRAALAAAAVAVGALGWHVGPRWTLAERLNDDLQAGTFPEAACDFMAEAGLGAPTDTDPKWSGYLLYRLHPPATVLADGRLIFAEDVADLLRRRFDGQASTFDEAVGRFRTLALVMPRGGLPPLAPERWRQVYADPVAEVWLPSPAWGALPRIEAWYDARGQPVPWSE